MILRRAWPPTGVGEGAISEGARRRVVGVSAGEGRDKITAINREELRGGVALDRLRAQPWSIGSIATS
jgi:hypothetical protein